MIKNPLNAIPGLDYGDVYLGDGKSVSQRTWRIMQGEFILTDEEKNLRDQFAGLAMAAIISRPLTIEEKESLDLMPEARSVAIEAYEYAIAMIVEKRERDEDD